MGQLDQSVADHKVALRELAGVLARATLAPEDDGASVVDLLLRGGFPEESDADTGLLDAIDPSGQEPNEPAFRMSTKGVGPDYCSVCDCEPCCNTVPCTAEPGPGVCRGCGGNFSHALADGKCDECRNPPLKCRYDDCPERNPVIPDEGEERVTCPTCREALGLPSIEAADRGVQS